MISSEEKEINGVIYRLGEEVVINYIGCLCKATIIKFCKGSIKLQGTTVKDYTTWTRIYSGNIQNGRWVKKVWLEKGKPFTTIKQNNHLDTQVYKLN